MGKPMLILNGFNLNRPGKREPDNYQTMSLQEVEQMCRRRVATRATSFAAFAVAALTYGQGFDGDPTVVDAMIDLLGTERT